MHSLKIVLFGDTGTGKTSIVKRFINDSFDATRNIPTHVVDIFNYDVSIDDIAWTVHFWDTSGSDIFNYSHAPILYLANGCIVVVDVMRPETHATLSNWISEIQAVSTHIPIMCIANKNDVDLPLTSNTMFEILADNQIPTFFVSAESGGNVVRAMNEAIKLALYHQRNPPDVIAHEICRIINPVL